MRIAGASTRLLTSQLFFPDLPEENARDGIFHEDLLLSLSRDPESWLGRFDFVLSPA